MFSKTLDPYENVVDFIGAAFESSEIRQILFGLVNLPDNIRRNTINKILTDMRHDKDSVEFIQIMEMMMNKKVLEAMNSVISDIQKAKPRSISVESVSKNSNSFTVLMGLITAL